jgi:hypothetical protein
LDGPHTARFAIELADSLPHLVGSDSDNGIVARVVVVCALKDINAYRAFFELAGMTRECLLNDVTQKSLAAAALDEDGRGEQRLQFGSDSALEIGVEWPTPRTFSTFNRAFSAQHVDLGFALISARCE